MDRLIHSEMDLIALSLEVQRSGIDPDREGQVPPP
jgi:hypothetical protein